MLPAYKKKAMFAHLSIEWPVQIKSFPVGEDGSFEPILTYDAAFTNIRCGG